MNGQEVMKQYRVEVRSVTEELGGGYEALFPQLGRGVVGYGGSPSEALEDLSMALPVFLEGIETFGQKLPEPALSRDWENYSGKFNVRLPKLLHARLARLAEEQGVSLNSMVLTILASGLGMAEPRAHPQA